MSTKTSIKRIALVAVSALGFGVMSVVPANAAEAALTEVTLGSFTATYPGSRVGVVAEYDSALTVDADADDAETVALKTAVVSAPAGSTATTTIAGEDINGVLDSGNTNYGSANVTYTFTDSSADTTADLDVRITPDVAGTYQVILWHDRDANGSVSTGEAYKTFTFTAVAGADAVSATMTVVNSTTAAGGANGSLVKIAITNSAGAPTALNALETFTLAATNSATVTETGAGNSGTGASITLTRSDFSNGSGVAWVNVTKAAAGSSVLSLTGTIGAAVTANSKTATITYRTVTAETVNEADGAITYANTSGVVETTAIQDDAAGRWDIKDDRVTSVSFEAAMDGAVADNEGDYVTVSITDTRGAITGFIGGVYDITATVDADNNAVFSLSLDLDNDTTTAETVSVGMTDEDGAATVVVGALDSVATTMTLDNDTVRAVVGSTVTTIATLKDQFALVMANTAVTVSQAGRNAHIANTPAVTNASGQITYSFTDAPLAGVSSITSTVSFTSGNATDDLTVTYVASLGVATVTLTSTGDTDTVAGTTRVDINASGSGAQATTGSASAVVKDANGSVLSGVPVAFSISGTSCAVPSNKAIVVTSTTGTAAGSFYGWADGSCVITATAGGVSATDTVYFRQQTLTEARTIAATVNGGIVTATVKDRFGNPIEGVTVNATRTGTGYFGTGASTATGQTDVAGQVDFIYNGEGTVTVKFSSTTYGQSDDVAGEVDGVEVTATTVGTSTTAETGVGAALAAAGVNSVAVVVSNNVNSAAEAAADAAAEAIDAANAATDAANLAAEAADAATVAAEEARDAADAATAAVEELATQVATLMAALKAQITTLANTVAKIAKKVRA